MGEKAVLGGQLGDLVLPSRPWDPIIPFAGKSRAAPAATTATPDQTNQKSLAKQ